MNVIESTGLGKQYGKSWALRDCTIAVPEGHLAALVGPNGAGKSTLMNIAVGLSVPTTGTVTVLGGQLAGSPAALDGIAFMAQDAPVYKNLSAGEMLHLTRNLNRSFDLAYAKQRLDGLGIPLKKKSGKLSGGQQAQLALTLALARHPRLLILDEPLSALDPLARQDFMATVMTSMTDDGVSVLLSSHAIAELERIADYLVVLGGGELRLAGETDDLLADHWILTGPAAQADRLAGRLSPVQDRRAGAQAHLLVRTAGPAGAGAGAVPPGWEAHPVSLEQVILGAYLVIRLAAWAVRGQYPLSVVTSNAKQFTAFGTPGQPGFPWILTSWVTGPGGKPASQAIVNQIQETLGGVGNGVVSVPKGYTIWTKWVPMSHYWPMQVIEAGWLLILAIAIGAAAVWLVRRRAA